MTSIVEKIRYWPSNVPRKRSPGPLDIEILSSNQRRKGGRRATPTMNPDAHEIVREDDLPALILPDDLARGIRQADELFELVANAQAVLQRIQIRLHVLEGVFVDLVDQEVKR